MTLEQKAAIEEFFAAEPFKNRDAYVRMLELGLPDIYAPLTPEEYAARCALSEKNGR